MTPYIMFGQSQYLGDYADAIHSVGGWLAKVVVNVPEVTPPRCKTFAERLHEYRGWLAQHHPAQTCEVVSLNDFQPQEDGQYLMGFRGSKVRGLHELIRRQFALTFAPLVHAHASVSPMATLAEGVFVGPGAVVTSFVRIGLHTMINRGVTIGHDTLIGDYCDISPSAALASGIRMEDHGVVGIGATVIHSLVLGEGCQVGGGAAVVKDVPPWKVMVGVPAKVLRDRPKPF